MSGFTRFRIALFEFLAFPAHMWLRVAAFLVGAKWVVVRDFTVEGDEDGTSGTDPGDDAAR